MKAFIAGLVGTIVILLSTAAALYGVETGTFPTPAMVQYHSGALMRNLRRQIIQTFPSKPLPSPKPTHQPTRIPTKIQRLSPSPTVNDPQPTVTVTPSPTMLTPTAQPTSTITPTPTLSPDTEPPKTNLIFPKQNGTIEYKTDGRICAVSAGPTDNRTNHNDIETAFHFDADEWSTFEKMRVYMCKDPLPNGPHMLYVKSRDAAGNVESEQTIGFTVAIEGN